MIISMITNMLSQQAQAARDQQNTQQLQKTQEQQSAENKEFLRRMEERQKKSDQEFKDMMKQFSQDNNSAGVSASRNAAPDGLSLGRGPLQSPNGNEAKGELATARISSSERDSRGYAPNLSFQ
ncbi:Na+-translocating ferredoxin:NAD+ oxidoreductase RnfG subunit [Bradyrhizobium sp. USDA 4524]